MHLLDGQWRLVSVGLQLSVVMTQANNWWWWCAITLVGTHLSLSSPASAINGHLPQHGN